MRELSFFDLQLASGGLDAEAAYEAHKVNVVIVNVVMGTLGAIVSGLGYMGAINSIQQLGTKTNATAPATLTATVVGGLAALPKWNMAALASDQHVPARLVLCATGGAIVGVFAHGLA